MWINILDIPEEGLEQEFDLPIIINNNAIPDTATARIKLLRFGKKILVDGTVKVIVALKCSRCLSDVSCPVDLDFREEYNPADETEPEGKQELSGDEMDIGFYKGEEIDLAGIVKEQVLLEVPMKPLCKIDCRGICSRCGTDINVQSCNCKDDHIDPRLAPLAKYKESLKRRKE
jgi:uncharacterized protein